MSLILPQAIYQELQLRQEDLGIKTILVDHNYDQVNLPQAYLPALIINVLSMHDNPKLFIGGLQRSSMDLIITYIYRNFNIDFTNSPQDLINEQLKLTQVQNVIISIFNKNIFLSPLMQSLQNGIENLNTHSRGCNKSNWYTKESELVHVYNINVNVMITENNYYIAEKLLYFKDTVKIVKEITLGDEG